MSSDFVLDHEVPFGARIQYFRKFYLDPKSRVTTRRRCARARG